MRENSNGYEKEDLKPREDLIDTNPPQQEETNDCSRKPPILGSNPMDNIEAIMRCDICGRRFHLVEGMIGYIKEKENNWYEIHCPADFTEPWMSLVRHCGQGEEYITVEQYLKDPQSVLDDLRQEEWFNEDEFNEMIERLYRIVGGRLNIDVEEAYERIIMEDGGVNTENLERILSSCEET